ncbi:MAG: DUF1345 domain-containing protein [Trebonia sp.]
MPTSRAPHASNRWRPYLQRWRHRSYFLLSSLIFLATFALALLGGMAAVRGLLCAFDIAAAVFLTAVARMFNRADPESMRTRARIEDGGHWGFLWSNIAFSVIVLVALGLELHGTLVGGVSEIVLAGVSLLLSWLFLNTMFALHYAHRFYGTRGAGGPPLEFPGTMEPDYWDFLYFAATIGMTFQVSDVQIADRRLRRLVLLHSVAAFFFNVIIVALTVNIVAGHAG